MKSKLNPTRIALGVSGGIDSTLAYCFALRNGYTVTPYFFRLAQPYQRKEEAALTVLGIPFVVIDLPICAMQPETPTEANYMIPGRNTVMATIMASTLPNEVWIVGLADENHPFNLDKNDQFYRLTTEVISKTFGVPISVRSPFSSLSKTELLQWGEQNVGMTTIEKTVSCYHPTLNKCGQCAACLKRYAGFFGAGLPTERFFISPMKTELARQTQAKYQTLLNHGDFSHYSKTRLSIFLAAYEGANG